MTFVPKSKLNRLAQSRFVLCMRESFLSVLPVYLFLQLTGLLVVMLNALAPDLVLRIEPELLLLARFKLFCWPLVMMVSFTTHFARAYGIDPLYALMLVLTLTLLAFLGAPAGQSVVQTSAWLMLASFVLPLVSVMLLCKLIAWMPSFDLSSVARYSPALSKTVLHGLPFFLILIVLAWPAMLLSDLLAKPLLNLGDQIPVGLYLIVHVLCATFLWWMGISGSSVVRFLTGNYAVAHDAIPGVSIDSLIYDFVVPGGCGASLALTFCLMWYQRKQKGPKIWRWALPLQTFNISEVLIFGLPVVGNVRLLKPFMLAPLLNAALVYLVVVEFRMLPVQGSWQGHWMTPYGLNAWLIGSSTQGVLALQAAVMAMSVLVYRPFVKTWVQEGQLGEASWALVKRMNIGPGLEMFAEARFVKRHEAQTEWGLQAQAALRLLQTGTLCMHYQPKLNLKTGQVAGLEALLRLRLEDGSFVQPGRFMPALEQTGFGDLLDLWVVRQVAEDLQRWNAAGFVSKVAINLSAATIGNDDAFGEILAIMIKFKALGLEAELLESSLIKEPDLVRARLGRLREAGVKVYVDDFGTGYSNLTVFHSAEVDVVKLDRSLLEAAAQPRGADLYREVCGAMQRLGYEVMAEGVETPAEADFVVACGVCLIQGWWVSRPLQAEAVPTGVAAVSLRFTKQARDEPSLAAQP